VDQAVSATDDSVSVSVVDTTAPAIACNAPAAITPSDLAHDDLRFTATATDACSGVSTVAIQSYSCARPHACRVRVEGDTITIGSSGGVGDVIQWTVAARDGSGNQSTTTCAVQVVNKQDLR
jgi:hypothetical protein